MYNVPLEECVCTLCSEDVGDEYHFIMQCKAYIGDCRRYEKRT